MLCTYGKHRGPTGSPQHGVVMEGAPVPVGHSLGTPSAPVPNGNIQGSFASEEKEFYPGAAGI